ncbi:MAG: cell surface protein SprA [Flavobacteriaceae bacterium]|nr:cell surface protein SprA [Flavobacteriaceae bacterium]
MRNNFVKTIFRWLLCLLFSVGFTSLYAQDKGKQAKGNRVKKDTLLLKYPFKRGDKASLYLNPASEQKIIFDSQQKKYFFLEKVGDYYLKYPVVMDKEAYKKFRQQKDMLEYFKKKIAGSSPYREQNDEMQKDLLPTYYINSKFFKTIFGSNTIEVAANGSLQVSMGMLYQNVDNPQLSERNRSNLTFDFDQQIGASVMAKIGTRLELGVQYDTKSTFDFQNRINLGFEPDEDDILRKIEVGNVSMPVKNSLIVGAQSLFGLGTELQFGPTTIRSVFAQQRSQMKNLAMQGGSTVEEFEMRASDYDDNRHFFLSHYFRDNYDKALENFPLINSPINITRVEVWVTNRGVVTENVRNIVALADIGEANPTNIGPADVAVTATSLYPNNSDNTISKILTINNPVRDIATVSTGLAPYKMQQGRDYSVLENAKKLEPTEYTIHPQLGYISLNRRLVNSDVLAVAFEYTISGDSKVYKVGEFSTDGVTPPKNLVVKLLRSEVLNTNVPLWDLMMKNVYSLQTYRVNEQGLRLELLYANDATGVPLNTLQNAKTSGVSDKTIMNLTHIDRLDEGDNYVPDGNGYFDYIEQVTINSEKGYVIFPVVEPFGKNLKNTLTNSEDSKYIFEELYDLTKYEVKNNFQTKDKYLLKGYFKGDSNSMGGGIPLGAFNVPRGSVRVTSNGRTLVEGIDYVVDYQMGRVQVINPALEGENVPIQVSVENNELFSMQNKRFIGVDVEHKFSDDFIAGASFLNLREKPFTQKVAFGSEPINNSIFGINASYGTEVPFLTKLVNKLPNIDTEVPSRFSIRGDFAYLRPGSPSQIELQGEEASYIDDFEGTQIPIEIRSTMQWQMASTPQYQKKFNFNGSANDLSYGYKRAKLAWYIIDPVFYGSSLRPDNIDANELSRAEVRSVSYNELFPEQELDITQSPIVRTFDLAYFPHERGSYNYDTQNVGADGKFTDPEERWAGITRPLYTTNFEQSNVEYIQFWLMDPFQNYSITQKEGLPAGVNPNDPSNQVGEVYFNLGSISEDVLKDGRKMYENGLPKNKLDTKNTNKTIWGKVPSNQSLLYTFGDDDEERKNQDIGLDGLDDDSEKALFGTAFGSDPSNDNFKFFKNSDYDQERASIITRYKKYNNTQGNSPTNNLSNEKYPTASTGYPDVEDINKDQTMNTVESYYQYRVSLNKEDLVVGKNHIVDEKMVNVTLPNGSTQKVRWLQFRVQVSNPDEVINDMTGFHSIRFMRIFLTKFKMPVVLRFGELELVRGDWRRYTKEITTSNIEPKKLTSQELQNFESGVVNIQENERRTPIPYVLPPGVRREILRGTTTLQKQNEQSISLKVRELKPNESRAVFKNTRVDLRMYKKLKMFLHAEGIKGTPQVQNNDVKIIFRLGSDLTENYYQIEKPLLVSNYNARTAEDIWLEGNNLSVVLEHLGKLKLQRLKQGIAPNELYPAEGMPMPEALKGYEIRVKGNPNLANIRTMMLGVKNVSSTNQNIEVWFNELRTSGFDNEGGWAAVVSADANFADFANVSATARKQTKGFGNVEQTVNERSQEDMTLYNVTTSVNAGQLLPKNWGVKLPVTYSHSEEFKDPKYDPQYQDVLFEDAVSINPNSKNAQDYTRSRSINLMNVRKEYNPESERKRRFYDVENLSLSYAFSELYHKDYNIKKSLNQNVKASANYSYNFEPKSIEPFKNWGAVKSKYLKLIRDFNFNLLPSTISVNSSIARSYNEHLSRTLIEGLPDLPALVRRDYHFDWDYKISYNLTKSLKFDFDASNRYIYDNFGKENVMLYDRFFNIGRPQMYNQKLNVSYRIPIDKLPFMDFVRADYNYTASYNWQGAPSQIAEKVGNTIQNANTSTLNTRLDFKRLYRTILPKKWRNKKSTLMNILTSFKDMRISYSSNNGTMMSGFKPEMGFLGRDSYHNSFAPTFGFVFGSQVDIRQKAIENGWLISRGKDDPYYNQMYSSTGFNKLDVSFEMRPVQNMIIEFKGMRTHTHNTMQQLDVVDNTLVDENPVSQMGSFSISTNMLGATFSSMNSLFEDFKSNRAVIAGRLANKTGQSIDGFGQSSQQVILPAFLAAYTGGSASKVSLKALRNIPIPGWNITYKGLMKNKWFKKNFTNFSLSHSYKSAYSIGNYQNNLDYNRKNPYKDRDVAGNYFAEKQYGNVSLIEEFSPLIKVDVKMKNSVSLNARINRDRSLMLGLSNNTITQETGTEYVLGVGYRFKDLAMKFSAGGRLFKLKGDLNLKADVMIRNSNIMVRAIDKENDQVTGGQRIISVKFLADYAVSKNFIASFYFDQNASRYAISTTFPRQSVSTGIRLRYLIGNN